MKQIIETTLILAVIALVGCCGVVEKPRDFFAAGGITIGAPSALKSGAYKIPIDFKTKIVHSGQWIDAVKTKVLGSDILATAIFTRANRESNYPGHIEIKGVSPGTYTLKYRDPDGAVHAIGPVILP